MTTEEQIAFLTAQLNQVGELLSQTQEELRATQEKLRIAHARIEELEKQKTPPPAFVKADVKKPQAEQKKPRKKRDAKHNRARLRSVPTEDSWSIGSSVARTVICVWGGSVWPVCER